jgi:hypothetical protein
MSNQTIENKVEINRMCTLKTGDFFIYEGSWRTVIKVSRTSIHFKGALGPRVRIAGKKSQLYVQIARKTELPC